MSTNAEAYFRQTQWGESRWWSWLSALWLTVIIWIVLSTIIGAPIPEIVRKTDPESVAAYYEYSNNIMGTLDPSQIALFGLGFILSTLIAVFCWVLWWVLKNEARKIFAWISGICMVISLVCMGMLYPMINSAEVNDAFMVLIGKSAIAYALMLASFPALLVGLYAMQRLIHKRTITSLHTAAARINWMRIIFAIGVTWAVLGTFTLIMHVTGLSPVKSTFDPTRFFAFAIATLIFIPLQSGTEEIVFRGYLNQGLGHYISNKWIVFVITSAMFAAMHLSNPEALAGAEEGGVVHLMVMSQYFMFGFILAVIVYFEGGLEAAIGVHAGNNMFAAMFVNYEGSVLPTPSMFLSTPNPGMDAPVGIIVLVLIAYILYRTRKEIIPAPPPVEDMNPKDVF